MAIILANNAITTIPAAVSSTDTSITVTDGTVFPELGANQVFYATIGSVTSNYEIVKVTAKGGNVLTIVRAQESTLAIPFPAGSRISLNVTVGNLGDYLLL